MLFGPGRWASSRVGLVGLVGSLGPLDNPTSDNINKTRRAITKVKRIEKFTQQIPFSKKVSCLVSFSNDPIERHDKELDLGG